MWRWNCFQILQKKDCNLWKNSRIALVNEIFHQACKRLWFTSNRCRIGQEIKETLNVFKKILTLLKKNLYWNLTSSQSWLNISRICPLLCVNIYKYKITPVFSNNFSLYSSGLPLCRRRWKQSKLKLNYWAERAGSQESFKTFDLYTISYSD